MAHIKERGEEAGGGVGRSLPVLPCVLTCHGAGQFEVFEGGLLCHIGLLGLLRRVG